MPHTALDWPGMLTRVTSDDIYFAIKDTASYISKTTKREREGRRERERERGERERGGGGEDREEREIKMEKDAFLD